ncbi:hypothetical protein P692DRAFT_20819835 [Suillus brevipes Sb2]|nr:hypothetical protein P692DRAFT_20819835 [Suillus brevipes Sb2]
MKATLSQDSSERTALAGDSEVKRSTLLFESMHFEMLEGTPVVSISTSFEDVALCSGLSGTNYHEILLQRVRSRILSLVGDDAKDASPKFCALIIPALCASAIKKSNYSEASQKFHAALRRLSDDHPLKPVVVFGIQGSMIGGCLSNVRIQDTDSSVLIPGGTRVDFDLLDGYLLARDSFQNKVYKNMNLYLYSLYNMTREKMER